MRLSWFIATRRRRELYRRLVGGAVQDRHVDEQFVGEAFFMDLEMFAVGEVDLADGRFAGRAVPHDPAVDIGDADLQYRLTEEEFFSTLAAKFSGSFLQTSRRRNIDMSMARTDEPTSRCVWRGPGLARDYWFWFLRACALGGFAG